MSAESLCETMQRMLEGSAKKVKEAVTGCEWETVAREAAVVSALAIVLTQATVELIEEMTT